jgi:hypothetical protein
MGAEGDSVKAQTSPPREAFEADCAGDAAPEAGNGCRSECAFIAFRVWHPACLRLGRLRLGCLRFEVAFAA